MPSSTDPVINTLLYAEDAFITAILKDAEAAIFAAAYMLYGPANSYLLIANDAYQKYKKNQSWSQAMKVAELERRRAGIYGTTFL